MASVIDLRLNQMSYLADRRRDHLPAAHLLAGFFGMNFDWMIGQIDTQLAFWLLGVGTSLAAALIAWRTVVRRSPIQIEGDWGAGEPIAPQPGTPTVRLAATLQATGGA